MKVTVRSPLPARQAGSVAKHDRADFAQEFLRRNPAYCVCWDRWAEIDEARHSAANAARHWGLSALFDPSKPVRRTPAIWRSDTASQVVTLVVAGDLMGAAPLFDGPYLADFLGNGDRQIVCDRGGIRLRLRLPIADPHARLAILLPPAADGLQASACDAARRIFAGLAAAEPATQLRPSALQHRRLALLLRVLDASIAGATNREIGTAIVYPWLAGTDAIAWKATGERRRVQRLLAEARDLSASGYRDLLRA